MRVVDATKHEWRDINKRKAVKTEREQRDDFKAGQLDVRLNSLRNVSANLLWALKEIANARVVKYGRYVNKAIGS